MSTDHNFIGDGGPTRLLRTVARSGVRFRSHQRILHNLFQLQSDVAHEELPIQTSRGMGIGAAASDTAGTWRTRRDERLRRERGEQGVIEDDRPSDAQRRHAGNQSILNKKKSFKNGRAIYFVQGELVCQTGGFFPIPTF